MIFLLSLAKKITKKTFESIITPVSDIDRVYTFVCKVKEMIPTLILRYVPSIQSIPLEQGMTWEPTYKALPTHGWVAAHLKSTAKRIIKSVHTSLAYELSFSFY